MEGYINSYSREIATQDNSLSPLTLLQTSIQLHPKQLREGSAAAVDGFQKRTKIVPPLLQAEMHPSVLPTLRSASPVFEEKLHSLKKVLPSASEVKLAALLNKEKGDMNTVVQCILDSPEEQPSMLESKPIRIIDHTEEGLVQHTPTVTPSATVKQLAQIPVDEGVLRSILHTAEKTSREGTTATREDAEGFNLISFHKPACANSPFTGMPDNENSKKLSGKPSAKSGAYRQCSNCLRDVSLQGAFWSILQTCY